MSLRLVRPRPVKLDPVDDANYFVALASHAGRLGAALKTLLAAPNNETIRDLAQQVMDDFDGWRRHA